MIQLDVGKQELLILIETLESDVSDLRMEIAATDSMDYREILKDKKEALKRVLESLRSQV